MNKCLIYPAYLGKLFFNEQQIACQNETLRCNVNNGGFPAKISVLFVVSQRLRLRDTSIRPKNFNGIDSYRNLIIHCKMT